MAFPPNPHGGFDLPPLNAAVGDNAYGMNPPSFARPGSAGFQAHPPSRTHSPLAGPGVTPSAAPPYHLPLPVPTHPQAYPPHHFYPPPPGGVPAPVPTYVDLERHFAELEREKRALAELLERTDRMMLGLRRAMDESRMHQPPNNGHPPAPGQQQHQQQQHHQPPQGHPQQPHQPQQHQPLPAEAVSLNRSASSQSRESVWPVNPPEGVKRD